MRERGNRIGVSEQAALGFESGKAPGDLSRLGQRARVPVKFTQSVPSGAAFGDGSGGAFPCFDPRFEFHFAFVDGEELGIAAGRGKFANGADVG